MFKVINKLLLGNGIKRLDVEAPEIARSFHAGQFVMAAAQEKSKWIPLTIVEADTRRGIITIIFRETGEAARLLGALQIGDRIFSISGPFGQAAVPRQVGTVVCAATDTGAAQLMPVCRAYSRAENKVIGVLGAKTKSELILETQMRIACHKIILTTEDGSYQRRGTVAEVVKELLRTEKIHLIYSIGELRMLKEISLMTQEAGVRNLIQVHTGISCGRGMCGSCRLKAGGRLVLGCQEGPEFDGHTIDFDYLENRVEHICRHEDQNQNAREKDGGFFKKIFKTEQGS